MTKEAILAWSGSQEITERTWAHLERWRALGYAVRASVTQRGTLFIEITTCLSDEEAVMECDTERPTESRPLLPPE